MSAPWSAIGVPIDSVGRAGGTEHAPAALREHDLPARVGAEDRGDLDGRIRGVAHGRAHGPGRRQRVRDPDHAALLTELLAPLGASPGLAGLSLGCLNPDKDSAGTFTERTCALLAGALAAR